MENTKRNIDLAKNLFTKCTLLPSFQYKMKKPVKMKANKPAASRAPTMTLIPLRETNKPLEDSGVQIELVLISLIHACYTIH